MFAFQGTMWHVVFIKTCTTTCEIHKFEAIVIIVLSFISTLPGTAFLGFVGVLRCSWTVELLSSLLVNSGWRLRNSIPSVVFGVVTRLCMACNSFSTSSKSPGGTAICQKDSRISICQKKWSIQWDFLVGKTVKKRKLKKLAFFDKIVFKGLNCGGKGKKVGQIFDSFEDFVLYIIFLAYHE